MSKLARIPWWAPVLLGVLILVLDTWQQHPFTLDDAYITFRYAENWVAGHGPVYNPGERVEGYTTFLWMALMAGAVALGLPVVESSKALGLVLASGCLVLVGRADRVVPGVHRGTAVAGTLILATSGIFHRWSMAGMEVPLVSFLSLAAVLLHLRGRQGQDPPRLAAATGLLAALAIMTRPDAGLVLGVLGLDRLVGLVRKRGKPASLVAMAGAFLLVAGAWFAWRYDYYGYLLPNTFYAKVGATSDQLLRGLVYLAQGLNLTWPLVLLLLGGLAVGFEGGLAVGAALVLLHLAYVVAVGGDVFWGYRFFAAYLPIQALAAAAALPSLSRWRRLPPLALGAALAVNCWWLLTSSQLNYESVVAKDGQVVGRWLAEHAPADALLATNIAGTVPYYSGLATIDTLGLNDITIAHREIATMGEGRPGHEKGFGAYVLSREPDYVIFASSRGAIRPKFLGDRELYQSRRFHQLYDLHVYPLDAPHRRQPLRFKVWVRRPEEGGRGLVEAEPSTVIRNVPADAAALQREVEEEEAEGEARE